MGSRYCSAACVCVCLRAYARVQHHGVPSGVQTGQLPGAARACLVTTGALIGMALEDKVFLCHFDCPPELRQLRFVVHFLLRNVMVHRPEIVVRRLRNGLGGGDGVVR